MDSMTILSGKGWQSKNGKLRQLEWCPNCDALGEKYDYIDKGITSKQIIQLLQFLLEFFFFNVKYTPQASVFE